MSVKKIRRNVLTKRRKYFKTIKQQLKRTFLVKGELYCAVCGTKQQLELHHIVPLSMNGSNEIDNLMPLCHDHHMEIHHENSDLVDAEGTTVVY